MNIVSKIISIISIFGFLACDSILEPQPDGTLSEDGIWKNNARAFAFLNNAYNNLPAGYNRISGTMLDAATDDAVCPDPLNPVHGFTNGGWSAYNIIDNVWYRNFEGIRKVNTFLARIDSVPLIKSSNELGTDETILRTRARMKGEAYFLRAFFYFELVKRYGAVPIVDKPLSPQEANELQRATTDACFQFILDDCDSAASRLPAKYGTTPVVIGYNDAKEIGRATKGAAMALKARALLYWASPLFNAEGIRSRWETAATAAKAVIELSEQPAGGAKVYALTRFTSTVNLNDLFVPNSVIGQYHSEIIFSTLYTNNTTVEALNGPISYGAKGMINPTQNLVDAFPMSNGRPVSDPSSGYDSSNPYLNRDPRLAMTVLTNGALFGLNDKTGTIETFVGGNDARGAYPNATHTGYYLRKFISPAAVWDGRTVNITRTWVLIRFAELYLNYAEARNEAFGPDSEVYAALRSLRLRAGLRPSDVQASLTKEQMRQLIQNERRIELAFEEHRFFDVRRWRLLDNPAFQQDFLKIRGVRIVKNEQGALSYNTDLELQQRVFDKKMYLYPVEASELLKNDQLTQNPDW
jgi:hypothetical protein